MQTCPACDKQLAPDGATCPTCSAVPSAEVADTTIATNPKMAGEADAPIGKSRGYGNAALSGVALASRAGKWGRRGFIWGVIGAPFVAALALWFTGRAFSIFGWLEVFLACEILGPPVCCIAGLVAGMTIDTAGELSLFRSKETEEMLDAIDEVENGHLASHPDDVASEEDWPDDVDEEAFHADEDPGDIQRKV